MNILFNLLPIRAGGGQQVAITFLAILSKESFGHNWIILAGKGTDIEIACYHHQLEYIALSYSYAYRFVFETFLYKSIIRDRKIDLIYHYAPCYYFSNCPQVIRSVYSNLYFPEIDFWRGLSFCNRIRAAFFDYLRLKRTLLADGIVFENPSMQIRAVELYGYPQRRTVYIEPSVSEFEDMAAVDYGRQGDFKILVLSNWYPNKNIQILPLVASTLRKLGCVDFTFVISLSREHPEIRKLIKKMYALEVDRHFVFIGNVDARKVPAVVKGGDAIILLSNLECFSSNILEAWYFRKLLIISNKEWATSICKDAALYVDRDDPVDISHKIKFVIENRVVVEKIIENSERILSGFSTPFSKVQRQVSFLEYIGGIGMR